MIKNIQIILDVLGVVSCVVCAVRTCELGYLVASIWAMTALIAHLDD